jgi:hypothetical protein
VLLAAAHLPSKLHWSEDSQVFECVELNRQVEDAERSREYRFFYNPMWNYFGDAQDGTAGSYYYDAGEHVNYYWHLFDQVLLRPELADRFDLSRLRIVKATRSISLVRPDGRPEPCHRFGSSSARIRGKILTGS